MAARDARFVALTGPGGRLEVVYRIERETDLVEATDIEALKARSLMGTPAACISRPKTKESKP